MDKGRSTSLGHTFFVIGMSGMLVVFLLNLVAIFLLMQPAAHMFSSLWWSQWFPAYVAWPAFLIMALIYRGKSVAGNDLASTQD